MEVLAGALMEIIASLLATGEVSYNIVYLFKKGRWDKPQTFRPVNYSSGRLELIFKYA